MAWVSLSTAIAVAFVEKTVGNRVPAEDELDGLDVAEMGGPGYPEELAAPSLADEVPDTARSHVTAPAT